MRNYARRPARILAGVLAGALALSASPILGFSGTAGALEPATGDGSVCEDVTPATEPFTDVAATDVAINEIICLVATGITLGVTPTTYEPTSPVTRRQMAKFLVRLADEIEDNAVAGQVTPVPAGDGVTAFTDIADETADTKAAIDRLADAGIAEGVTATTFVPEAPVTRRQMAKFIVRLQEFMAGEDITPDNAPNAFTDDEGDTGEDELNTLAAEGVFVGNAAPNAGTVSPGANISRRQMALVIVRKLQYLFEEGVITRIFAEDDRVTLTSNSVAQGGTVTGTITDATSATVSGCGLTNEPVQDTNAGTAGIQFSETIPFNQATGSCTLTFTIVPTGGGAAVTETKTVTVTTGNPGAAATTRPELVSATLGATTLAGQVSPTNPLGTRVTYVFDENVSLFPPNPGNFFVYEADGDEAQDGGATVISVTGNTVVINFPNIDTAAEAAVLTLATVGPNAVTDAQGQVNPDGDAAIGTAAAPGSGGGTAGITNGPDLLSVGNFRAANVAGFTAVDFTFDEAAFVEAIDGFDLIAVNGVELNCTGPLADDAVVPPSGGTSPGGNGTTVITVTCANIVPATTLTAAAIARGTVVAGSLSDTAAPAGNLNELQAADVSGTSSEPDLVSATFQPSAGVADDQVLFVFDENVATAVANRFAVYDIGGTSVVGTAFAINPGNPTQVLVNFPDGTLSDAVGATVIDDAVTATDNGLGNEQDEVGVANAQTTAGQTPGQINAPELRSVALSVGTDIFNNPTGFQALYTFDEPITVAVNAGDFKLLLADGTILTATTCTRVAANAAPPGTAGENQVRCTAYGAATSAQVGAATVGTVGYAGVVAVDDGKFNPEGAERTTGGTGTPAA